MKKITLGVIGCGNFVRYHLNTIAKEAPEFQVIGLCDIVPAKAEKLRNDLFAKQAPALYTDHKTMLKELSPQAVIVSTPHTLHYPIGRDALLAGAHVMVEKPMVTDSTDAREFVKLAGAKKKVLSVAIQGMHTDTFAYAKQLVSDGTLGPLQHATCVLAQGWMNGTRGSWRQNPKLSGGGQLYDSTCHVISAMMFLVDSQVKEVFCWTDNKGCPVDINAVAVIKFANGCMGTISSGGNCGSWKSHLILQCEKAVLEVSAHGGDFRVYGKAMENMVKSKAEHKEINSTPKGWKIATVSPIRNYADSILGKSTPRVGGRMGILVSDLMDALYASAKSGKPARVTKKMPKM